MTIRINMCKLASEQGHFDEAERLVREDIAATEQIYGDDSAPPINLYQLLGNILAQQHLWDQARASEERALTLAKRFLPADHPITARCQWTYGAHLCDSGQYEAAEPALRAAITAFTTCDPPNPRYATRATRYLANCLDRLNRPADARALRDQLKQQQQDGAAKP